MIPEPGPPSSGPLTPDLTMADLMRAWPVTVRVVLRHKMRCVGCPVARFCTIEEACGIYALTLSDFMDELNRAITPPTPPR